MQEAALRDAVVAMVPAEQLVTVPAAVHTLDLATMAARDADFTADFRLEAPPVRASLVSPALRNFLENAPAAVTFLCRSRPACGLANARNQPKSSSSVPSQAPADLGGPRKAAGAGWLWNFPTKLAKEQQLRRLYHAAGGWRQLIGVPQHRPLVRRGVQRALLLRAPHAADHLAACAADALGAGHPELQARRLHILPAPCFPAKRMSCCRVVLHGTTIGLCCICAESSPDFSATVIARCAG